MGESGHKRKVRARREGCVISKNGGESVGTTLACPLVELLRFTGRSGHKRDGKRIETRQGRDKGFERCC
jgi:hypothetical protein